MEDRSKLAEIRRLADIYHTMDSTRYAVILGSAIGLAFGSSPIFGCLVHGESVRWEEHGAPYLAAELCAGTLVSYVTLTILHENRPHSLMRRVELLKSLLRDVDHSCACSRFTGRGMRGVGNKPLSHRPPAYRSASSPRSRRPDLDPRRASRDLKSHRLTGRLIVQVVNPQQLRAMGAAALMQCG